MNQQAYAPTSHVSVIANSGRTNTANVACSGAGLAGHNPDLNNGFAHLQNLAIPSPLNNEDANMQHLWNPYTHWTQNSTDYPIHLDPNAHPQLGHRLSQIPPNLPFPGPFDQVCQHPSQLNLNMPTYPTYNPAPKRRTGGRRPKEEEDSHVRLSHEEKMKRDQRRQRNKEAAARCRQRRLNTLQQLTTEVDKLNREKMNVQIEVERLRHENDELRNKMRNHNCCLQEGTALKQLKIDRPPYPVMHNAAARRALKRELDDPVLTQCSVAGLTQMDAIVSVADMSAQAAQHVAQQFGENVERPHSLPLSTGMTPNTPGISLQTPSRGFASYDLLGGSTGLTPTNVTNMMPVSLPTPNLDTPIVTMAPLIPHSNVPTTLKSL